jgi:hypothetical protein
LLTLMITEHHRMILCAGMSGSSKARYRPGYNHAANNGSCEREGDNQRQHA